MRVLGINGSPRKNWNTAKLIAKALEGSASKGAETEMINLYDLKYTGCTSCFACKRLGGKSYGKCAVKDDLRILLDKIEECDAMILGSPIYFGEVTGEMRSFLERLFFQYLAYSKDHVVLTPKKIPSCFIYTMNAPEQVLKQIGYEQKFDQYAGLFGRLIGPSEYFSISDTYQFEDYSKYETSMFNVGEKIRKRDEEFPKACDKVFEIGARIVSNL